jgi:hypothetical protein
MATENDLDLELDDIDMDLDDISGFHDNSTADPEGVWVKSGPEDVPPPLKQMVKTPYLHLLQMITLIQIFLEKRTPCPQKNWPN